MSHLAGADRVIDGRAGHARILKQGFIGLEVRARGHFVVDPGAQGRLVGDLAAPFQRGDGHLLIQRIAQIVGLDGRVDRGVGGLDADGPAAFRPHLAGGDGQAGLVLKLHLLFVDQFVHVHGRRQDMELDVGAGKVRPRLAEHGDMGRRQGQEPLALEHVFQGLAEEARSLGQFVDRNRSGLEPVGGADHIMVLQILADPGRVDQHRNPIFAQQFGRPDAGQLQQLGGIDRAAAQDHFARRAHGLSDAVADELDPDGLLALEQHLGGQGVGFHPQIGAAHHRMQIGHGGRAALAVLDRQLIVADALLVGPVDVGIAGNAGLFTGVDHGVGDLVGLGHVRDVEWAANPVPAFATATLLVLGAEKIGLHVRPGPSLAAQLAPVVVVGMLAADIEQAVDRGRAAQDLAARPHMHPPAGAGIGLGGIEPIDLGILQRLGIAHRHVDHQVGHELRGVLGWAVVAAGLEQDDLAAAIGAEPVGQDATRRSGAHDHIVGFEPVTHGLLLDVLSLFTKRDIACISPDGNAGRAS